MANQLRILALRTLVCAKLAAEHGQEMVVETLSKGDSQGNGLAEQAVREVKAKTRTLKFHTGELVGVLSGRTARSSRGWSSTQWL